MMRAMRVTVRIVVIGWMVTLLAACGARQKRDEQNFPVPGDTSLIVSEFTIQGVKALDEGELRAGLHTSEASWRARVPWLPVVGEDPETFNYVYWRQDLDRIRTFYYAHGYFDAKVVSEQIRENPAEGTVSIAITVSEGTPVTVKEIELDGLATTDVDVRPLLLQIPLQVGKVFTQASYIESRARIAQELEKAGFAYVETRGRALIEPGSLSATVVFHVDPGPRSVFGDVTIEGLNEIDRALVREAITIEAGQRYSPAALQQTQERVYDLGVFALVKVSPQLSGKGDEQPGDGVKPEPEAEMPSGGGLADLVGAAQSNVGQARTRHGRAVAARGRAAHRLTAQPGIANETAPRRARAPRRTAAHAQYRHCDKVKSAWQSRRTKAMSWAHSPGRRCRTSCCSKNLSVSAAPISISSCWTRRTS